jgi:hypothetical protein
MTMRELADFAGRTFRDERLVRADEYRRALAFMNEKGVLEEFVDRELAAAHATHPVADRDIRLSME